MSRRKQARFPGASKRQAREIARAGQGHQEEIRSRVEEAGERHALLAGSTGAFRVLDEMEAAPALRSVYGTLFGTEPPEGDDILQGLDPTDLGRLFSAAQDRLDSRPKTLQEAFERWPESLWLWDGAKKSILPAGEVMARHEANIRRFHLTGAAKQRAFDNVFAAPIRWRGSNVWLPTHGLEPLTGRERVVNGAAFFLRLLSISPAGAGVTPLRDVLQEHEAEAFADCNLGNSPPLDGRFLKGIVQGKDFLARAWTAADRPTVERWLASGVEVEGTNVFLVDQETGDRYYLVSYDPKVEGEWADFLARYADRPEWLVAAVRADAGWQALACPHGTELWSSFSAAVAWFLPEEQFKSALGAINAIAEDVRAINPGAQIIYATEAMRIKPDSSGLEEDPEGTRLLRAEREASLAPEKLPKDWRSDARLVRFLADSWGVGVARRWQRPPLVYLSRKDRAAIEGAKDQIRLHAAHIEHLPWSEFVLDLGMRLLSGVFAWGSKGHVGLVELNKDAPGHLWCRVTEGSRFWDQTVRTCPWLDSKVAAEEVRFLGEASVVVEAFVRLEDGTFAVPIFCEYALRDWGHAYRTFGFRDLNGKVADGAAKEDAEGAVQSLCQPAMWVLAYLSILNQMPDYLVQEWEPGAGRSSKHEGEASPKPWTRSDLPTIRLIDPSTITVRRGVPGAGTHASPRGHSRRGHPVVLKHPRFYDHAPFDERFVPGRGPQMAPPPMAAVFYEREGFLSGQYEAGKETHVWSLLDGWRELVPRIYFVKDTWVGPEQGIDQTGRAYRVLLRESGAEIPDPDLAYQEAAQE